VNSLVVLVSQVETTCVIAKYRIMSIKTQSIKSVLKKDGIIPNEISILFVSSDESRAVHCLNCGKFLLYSQHRILAVVEDDLSQVMNTSPFTIQCQKCGNIYKLNVI